VVLAGAFAEGGVEFAEGHVEFAEGHVEFAEGHVDFCARLPLLSRLERWCGVCGQELGRELGAERVVDGFDRLAQAANILGISTPIYVHTHPSLSFFFLASLYV